MRVAHRLQPLERYVALLCIATILPLVLFSAVLLQQLVAEQRHQLRLRTQALAERVADLLDGRFENLIAVSQALAASPTITDGDLAAFRRQAMKTVAGQKFAFLLRSHDGRLLMSTRLVNRSMLARLPPRELRKVLATGRPSVSDIYVGTPGDRPSVSISVPVPRGGRPAYVLSAVSPSDSLLAALGDRVSEASRWIALTDPAGRLATPPLPDDSSYGTPEMARSRLTGWRVIVRIPLSSGIAVATTWTRDALTIFGLLSLAAGGGAAIWFGRIVSRPIRAIAAGARSMARGEPRTRTLTRVLEIHELEKSLNDTASLLQRRALERDEAALQLRELNQQLEQRVLDRTAEVSQAHARLAEEARERAEVESQLRHMQKLEAIGMLTGGIAHDFNNMLSVVIGSLELAERRLAAGDTDVEGMVRSALNGAASAADLTRRLLAFGRQQSLSPVALDLNDLVEDMHDMLRRTLGESFRIRLRLAKELWTTFVDRSQMESAVLNLVINARDAMADGGTLTFETANAEIARPLQLAQETVEPGSYVILTITDDGTGMSPEVLERVFDPFFTTKETGRGTGLGLSQVHGFIRQSKGHVQLTSRMKAGTAVRLYLPKCDALPEARRPVVEDAVDREGADKVILVVEDDERVRAMSVDSIRELGYVVMDASGGEEALATLASPARIDLLFTDVMMPGMDGRTLASEAATIRPDLKVIYVTGYSRNMLPNGDAAEMDDAILMKPYTLMQLQKALRGALAATRASLLDGRLH